MAEGTCGESAGERCVVMEVEFKEVKGGVGNGWEGAI